MPLAGYRRSPRSASGTAPRAQLQLDVYGEVLAAAALLAAFSGRLDRDHGRRLAEMADLVGRIWRRPDAGIWEVRGDPAQFIQSKMMCAVALDRAVALADSGYLPARTRDAGGGGRGDPRVRRERRLLRDEAELPTRSPADDGARRLAAPRRARAVRPRRRTALVATVAAIRPCARSRPVRSPLSRRRRPPRRGRRLRRLLVLAGRGARPSGTARRGHRADGRARRARQRRRPLRRGDRSEQRRLPRQLPAGLVAPRPDQRRGRDRRGES